MSDESIRAVKSADRVLDVFELFARRGREMSHAQIADQLGIPKSSLSQLLATLVSREYLEVSADRRNYRLGNRLLALARKKAAARDVVEIARPVLAELTRSCGESSALNLLEDDEAVVACAEMAPQRLVSHMREGDRAPLYATSSGKIFLGSLSDDDLSAYLRRTTLRRSTPHTLSSKAALRAQVLEVRHSGVARSQEEYTPGIVGLAMPVRDVDGTVVAALNVAMPAVRASAAHCAFVGDALRRATAELSARLADG